MTSNTLAQAAVGTKRGPWHPRPPGIPHGDIFACSVIPFFLLKGKCREQLWWGRCSCELSREWGFKPVQSMLGEPPPPLPHLDGTVLVTLLGLLGSLGTLRYDICYFLSLSSIWRWSTAKALTLSSPRAPWPFPCPRQGSRPLRFCGLQTPHPRGQSRQKPPLWGVLLAEGTSIF